MKKCLLSLRNALLIALLVAVATYIVLYDFGMNDNRDEQTIIPLTHTAVLNEDRRKMAEAEDALRQARHRHAQEMAVQARRVKALEARVEQLQQYEEAPDRSATRHLNLVPAKPVRTMPKSHSERAQDREPVVLMLEDQLSAERDDAACAESIELRMAELLNARPELEGNDLIHTRCGRTFCRVEFQHENATAESQLLAMIANRVDLVADFDEYLLYQTTIDDSVGSVFFVSRKGHELPIAIEHE